MLDADQLVTFILGHKWLGLVILFLTYFGRLLKSDSAFPVTFERFRPLMILVLGQIVFGCVAVQSGVPIKNAVVTAAVVGLVTLGGFGLAVKTIFNGREIPDWLKALVLVFPPKTPGDPPTPKGPTNLPPGIGAMLISCALFLSGCAAIEAQAKKDGATMAIETTRCLLGNIDRDIEDALAICIKNETEREAGRLLIGEERQRIGQARAVAAAIALAEHASACSPDAGVDGGKR